MRAAVPVPWRHLVSDSPLLPTQFAEIMMKIEEYISKQAKASEGAFSPPTRDSTVAAVMIRLEEELHQGPGTMVQAPQGAASETDTALVAPAPELPAFGEHGF